MPRHDSPSHQASATDPTWEVWNYACCRSGILGRMSIANGAFGTISDLVSR